MLVNPSSTTFRDTRARRSLDPAGARRRSRALSAWYISDEERPGTRRASGRLPDHLPSGGQSARDAQLGPDVREVVARPPAVGERGDDLEPATARARLEARAHAARAGVVDLDADAVAEV